MASSTESGAKKQPMCPTCVGLELLTEDEIRQSMATRPLWGLKAGGGGSDSGASNNTKEERPVMERAFVAKNFQAAIDFINAAAEACEAMNHHPDFHLTGYRNVRMELFTHSLGGLTKLDFELADALDAIPATYSPKWLKEHPEAQQGKALGAGATTTQGN